MSPVVATYPPLGQVTTLQDPAIAFHAVLEVPSNLVGAPWQLALWHSDGSGGEWTETQLLPSPPDVRPTDLHEVDDAKARLYFTGSVTAHSSLTFTVKYRRETDASGWMWARSEQGSEDGLVLVDQKPTREDDAEDLPDLIQDLNPALKWKSEMSQSPGTRLWSIDVGVDEATGDESAFADVPLGIPWGEYLRWFALVRPWAPWLAPRQGKSSFELDKDALLCSFLSPQGKHLVFLGTSDVDNVSTLFRSGDSGRLVVSIRNDKDEPASGIVLVAVGDNIENTIAAVMYQARSLAPDAYDASRSHPFAEKQIPYSLEPSDDPNEDPSKDPKAGWYETWPDGLGYCTWNSLGQDLTDEKILKALDTLAENKISITNLIIDDNWQDIDYRGEGQWQHGWNNFQAEPKKFPRGLKPVIQDIRAKHKNIQRIYIWHALLGYWAGLAPSGPLAKKYKTIQVTRTDREPSQLPIDGQMTVVAPEDAPRFYDDFYRFLSYCGITGVKTDGQYMLDTLSSRSVRRTVIPATLDAWTLASLVHMAGNAISCMSLAPPIIFRSLLPAHARRPPLICRNSDDYYPPDPTSHPWHVWANAHTALLTRHLHVLPDWDMFQTGHAEYGAFHAAARCVSGGPVYITDVPGEHNLELIKQITGVTTYGNTVVFRPSAVGRALEVYTAYAGPETGVLLKVGAFHGPAARGTGIVGVFNVAGRPLVELVPLSKFPGVEAGGDAQYIVRSHVTGWVTPVMAPGAAASVVTVSLGVRGYDVLCAYPLSVLEPEGGEAARRVYVAPLGLVGKMTGCAAVLRTAVTVRENGRVVVETALKALGVLGIYISTLPELSVQDDFMVMILGQPVPAHTVSVNAQDAHVLDVDIETAWKEMGLHPGWSNEVRPTVYFPLVKK
ncbi:glycoside hydrolase [Staphylotrichum tortipilum]|uniref:Glycoside hydrolase n=1 Tax=Staphylotrichum tortipilum TaxID=2831512 RepID=A0AAN6MB41_9PEZI|nr:glycoside hydrolase [Staphylotrichum longicolle]